MNRTGVESSFERTTPMICQPSIRKRRPPFCRFGILIPIIGLTLVCVAGCKPKIQPVSDPPVVEVVAVRQQDVPVYREWVGSLDGDVNAQIRAQVTGYLSARDYQEGSFVRKGDPLFEIDPRPFQALLNQAKGQLAQAEAQLEKTALDVKRYTPLVKTSASPGRVGRAAPLAAKASVAAAKAAVEKAALDLGFTRVTSPIDGIAGIALAQVGDLVGPGASGNLTTVSTVNPIRAYISLSEQEYLEAAAGQTPLNQLELKLVLADGSVFPPPGRILFADREVNPRTGTIKVVAGFDNPGNLLRPGQFIRVRALLKIEKGALLVPRLAVSELQGVYQVAVVGADNRVDVRSVTPGERLVAQWVIDQGLAPGERIVTTGIQKVRQGMLVAPQPAPTGQF